MSELQQGKIFIIDDNLQSRMILQRIFNKEEEYAVKLASNREEALKTINDYIPDLILLDIELPGISGYEFAETLKTLKSVEDVPIIFLTGKNDQKSRLKAFENGGVDYINKPFSPIELLARVKVHTKLRRMNLELKLKNELLAMREAQLNYLVEERTYQLKEQLHTNSLTSLPNRLSLLKDIKKSERPILILLNIDAFKEINSFYGHIIGDNLLVELSDRLNIITERFSRQLYKLHADEFAVLIDDKLDINNLVFLVQELHDICELKPYLLKPSKDEEHKIVLDISIGVSYNQNKDHILELADMALKYAKRKRVHWSFYDNSLEIKKEYGDNLKWTRIINSAINDNRIVVFFQPIFSNKDTKIEKYETLVRLVNESGQIIPPGLFLHVAKKSKQYVYITKAVIKEAFSYFHKKRIQFTINLSIEDILNKDTVEYILDSLKFYDIGRQVVFEILESEGIERYEEVFEFIQQVKKLGCRIAIDDFGSGYSNFSHILKLEIDYIKIDSSLIENIDVDRNSQIIVETIVKFCKKLNIRTIAEKVHSKAVFETVVELGVCFSQGFYLGKPIAYCQE